VDIIARTAHSGLGPTPVTARWRGQLDSLGYNQVFDARFRAATGVGGLSPEVILDATIAERLFGGVGVDRFPLEYDTERAGGFAPLRFVAPGTTVVLGLVSSKVPELESPDDLRRRIEEASKYVPIGNLALSPQCGFASTARGNLLTVDDERRKLALVAETAREVWG
jgi:hypothetical protein